MARILLADPNPVTRALARKTLLMAGHSVVDASGGGDAMDVLDRAPFDLVVLDTPLPDANVTEVVNAIRARPGHLMTPVVTLAESEHEDTTTLAALAGLLVSRVRKPFTPHDLTDAVTRELLAARQLAARAADETIRVAERRAEAARL